MVNRIYKKIKFYFVDFFSTTNWKAAYILYIGLLLLTLSLVKNFDLIKVLEVTGFTGLILIYGYYERKMNEYIEKKKNEDNK